MSASFSLGELEPADRLAELHRASSRTRARSRSRRAPRPSRPTRCRTAPRSGTTAGPSSRARPAAPRRRAAGTSSRISSEVTDARSESLRWMSCVREARRVGRDDEPADALVGLGPHDRDVGDAAVGDPHLRAVQDPVAAVAPRVRAHATPGRCPSRARSGRSSRWPRPAAMRGSHSCFCSSLPYFQIGNIAQRALHARRTTGTRCRRPPAPCTRGRRRRRSRRRSRSPVRCIPSSPSAPSSFATSRGNVAALEPVLDARQHPVADELAHGVADHPLLVGEERVDVEEVERVDVRGHDGA